LPNMTHEYYYFLFCRPVTKPTAIVSSFE